MDLWEKIQKMRVNPERYNREYEDLCGWRLEERSAERPTPLCCPAVSGFNVICASFPSEGQEPVWKTGASNAPEIHHCPFCGTHLPGFRKKEAPPPHLCQSDDYYCGLCRKRLDSCFCSLPQSAWEADNAPRIVAATALITEGRKILSVSRKTDPNDKGLPGGRIEPGETPEQALERELFEETGLKALDYHLVFDASDDHQNRCVTYRVTRFEGTIQTTEKGVVEWVEAKRLTESSASFQHYNIALLGRVDPTGYHYG